MDSLGLCYTIVKATNETLPDFLRKQTVVFSTLPDTVIKDERGLFIGKKLTLGNSYIQWLDSSTVTSMFGMPLEVIRKQFGIKEASFDTLSLDSGFLENYCEFYFKRGVLVGVKLENWPD